MLCGCGGLVMNICTILCVFWQNMVLKNIKICCNNKGGSGGLVMKKCEISSVLTAIFSMK